MIIEIKIYFHFIFISFVGTSGCWYLVRTYLSPSVVIVEQGSVTGGSRTWGLPKLTLPMLNMDNPRTFSVVENGDDAIKRLVLKPSKTFCCPFQAYHILEKVIHLPMRNREERYFFRYGILRKVIKIKIASFDQSNSLPRAIFVL